MVFVESFVLHDHWNSETEIKKNVSSYMNLWKKNLKASEIYF